MEVRIVASESPGPAEKLAECELVFMDGVLTGMKLVGFSIWRSRRGVLPSVTFPARAFMANGERRSFSLLRAETSAGTKSQEALRATIVEAYLEYEARQREQTSEGDGGVAVADASIAEASEGIGESGSDGLDSDGPGSVDDGQ